MTPANSTTYVDQSQLQFQQQSSTEIRDMISAMRGQEAKMYRCEDYLNKDNTSGASTSQLSSRWREKISEWYFKMVDHFEFSREVVSISLSYLDRFLSATQKAKGVCVVDPHLAQLAAMTSLHLAVKLHESKKIKMSSLADLSRGHFSTEMIEQMEINILSTLGWHVHPTTSLQFVDQFAKLLCMKTSVREEVFEMSRFLTELAVCDSYFVSALPSNVAYACMLVALEFGGDVVSTTLQSFVSNMGFMAGMQADNATVEDARSRIREIYMQSAAFQKPMASTEKNQLSAMKATSVERSPTCVVDGSKAFVSSNQ